MSGGWRLAGARHKGASEGLAANIRAANERTRSPSRRQRRKDRERRPRRLPAWQAALLVVAVVLMGFLVLTVFPIHSYLAQQTRISHEEAQLGDLRAENSLLGQRSATLRTPAEIERLARSQYGMVRPGEIAYAILPGPDPKPVVPDIWPFR